MKLEKILTTVFACASLAGASSAAVADDTGFAQIHSMVRVGGKTCFADHSHSGSGAGGNRKIAEMQAINSWYGFTAGEYGSDWANLNKAVKKSMKCSGSGANCSCDLEATPCK